MLQSKSTSKIGALELQTKRFPAELEELECENGSTYGKPALCLCYGEDFVFSRGPINQATYSEILEKLTKSQRMDLLLSRIPPDKENAFNVEYKNWVSFCDRPEIAYSSHSSSRAKGAAFLKLASFFA